MVSTLAKNATKPNPFEIILLQTIKKENNCKTEKNVGESSCNSGDGTDQTVQSLMFMMMMMMMMMTTFRAPTPLRKARRWAYLRHSKKDGVQQALFQTQQQPYRQPTPTFQQHTFPHIVYMFRVTVTVTTDFERETHCFCEDGTLFYILFKLTSC